MTKQWGPDDVPGGWREWRPLDAATVALTGVEPEGEAWARRLPDDAHGGLPAIVIEVCSVGRAGFSRFATRGVTLTEAGEVAPDRELLDAKVVLLAEVKSVSRDYVRHECDLVLHEGSMLPDWPEGVAEAWFRLLDRLDQEP